MTLGVKKPDRTGLSNTIYPQSLQEVSDVCLIQEPHFEELCPQFGLRIISFFGILEHDRVPSLFDSCLHVNAHQSAIRNLLCK